MLPNQSESIIKPPNSTKIKAGLVVLQPGQDVGEHITTNREEIIVVLEGTATAVIKDEAKILEEKDCCYIPNNTVHNIKNQANTILKYYYIVSLH
ncbi:cupin domain-containing protein [Patescibacteria group bacterium]|nr:cupin domain-containing protein [Patescibacteria group bacterium]MBU1889929.1 cupin domain-containing protein [Patescibacteria group bacterium]